MKWLSKFQDGGQLRKIIGSLTSLVKRAQNKDTEAVQQIKAILEDSQAAQLLDMVRQTAPDLLDAMESIAQSVEMEKNGGSVYLHSLKCGGKSKKARKAKKAENGQELNARPARLAKGKKLCPCSLKKIGGRIVEVDCDGNIVWNKQGGQMVIKAYDGLKIGGQTIAGFSADHLKTADDIRQMQGVENDIQYYYDPSTQSVMSMKYGANGWENPEVVNFADQNPVFGQGEGQINLWKDGYNLQTGLMPNQQVKRNYGYGITGITNTRAETDSPLVRGDDGNLRLQYGKRTVNGNEVTYDNSSVNLTYSPAQMARIMRAQRKADYWANREAGVSKDVARNEKKMQRRMDRNTVWGVQYKDYGNTGYVQNSADGDYQSLYNSNQKRQAAEAKLAAPVGDVIQSNNSTQTTTTTNGSTVGSATVKKATSRFANGGWLQKYGNGGQVKKFELGQLIENVLTFGKPKLTEIISPKNWVSTTNAPYSYPMFQRDSDNKEAFHPEAKGLFFIPDRGLVWRLSPGFSEIPTWYPKKENFMAYPHDDYNGRLEGQISPDVIPGDTYLEYPTLRVGSRLSDAQTVLNEQSKKIKETMFQQLTPETDELNPDKLKAAIERQQTATKKAETDKKAAAHNAKVKTFYSKMSDSDKRALQDMLKVAGYYKGEVDGLIGLKTLEALRQFQAAQKLTVDSMAGRNTFDALRAATRQTAQPIPDQTAVPGYTQAAQLLNQMNAAVIPVVGTTGGWNLDDVHQGRDIQLVGPKVGFGATSESDIPKRKQGGWLNKKF